MLPQEGSGETTLHAVFGADFNSCTQLKKIYSDSSLFFGIGTIAKMKSYQYGICHQYLHIASRMNGSLRRLQRKYNLTNFDQTLL